MTARVLPKNRSALPIGHPQTASVSEVKTVVPVTIGGRWATRPRTPRCAAVIHAVRRHEREYGRAGAALSNAEHAERDASDVPR